MDQLPGGGGRTVGAGHPPVKGFGLLIMLVFMKSVAAIRGAHSPVAERLRRYGWVDDYDPPSPNTSWMAFLSVRIRGMKEDLPNRNGEAIPLLLAAGLSFFRSGTAPPLRLGGWP